jgi:hypothetical protein
MCSSAKRGAGTALAVDEAGATCRHVLQHGNAERIAGGNDQTLVAAHEVNQPLRARLQPRLVFAQDFTAKRALRNMESGELATAIAERDHAVEAANEADIELRSGPGAQEFAQLRKREIVAGEHRQRRIRRVEDFVELLLDLRGCAFQVRRQPRVDALADPKQPFAERGKLCAAALFFGDERLAHTLGPSGDETPGLSIRHTDLRGRLCQLAGVLDGVQEREQFRFNRFSRLQPGLPD